MEPKNLAEWLEHKGNPKHHITPAGDGLMAIAIEEKGSLNEGCVTLYKFSEKIYPNGHVNFWISFGWVINKEMLPALRDLLNNEMAEELPEPEKKEGIKMNFDETNFDVYMTLTEEQIAEMADNWEYETPADLAEDILIWAVNHAEKNKVMEFYHMTEEEYSESRKDWADEFYREVTP
jgi:hypothetical protein